MTHVEGRLTPPVVIRTQDLPGFDIGNLLWSYPTSTIRDNNGRELSC